MFPRHDLAGMSPPLGDPERETLIATVFARADAALCEHALDLMRHLQAMGQLSTKDVERMQAIRGLMRTAGEGYGRRGEMVHRRLRALVADLEARRGRGAKGRGLAPGPVRPYGPGPLLGGGAEVPLGEDTVHRSRH
ncbi:hypothetical protein [Sphingomicrobium aestuariivivum]|uniref:hypothetical protein n=1 Tax=Sphingomicrobium aestuariivivum TaxID=1582356 RepID=UPI001FD6E27B|nr:hypothetical protein [Sphingomicrobium aestuariivivum]MCJ8190568.1 hypothetical protein [Sphingomicrobium aestuariivivum]